MGKRMWRKHHHSVFQDHIKYIHNDIVKPFRAGILQYTGNIREMHNLAKFLTPPMKKGDQYDQAYWTVHDIELSEDDIFVATKDSLPSSNHNYIQDKEKKYLSLLHK